MRKSVTVTIDDEGRDKGKVFVLTEMPASQTERWALRAFFALGKAGIQIPADIAEAGIAGLLVLGLAAFERMHFEDAEPLLNDMLQCVKAQPSPGVVRDLIEDDIEEVRTYFRLRKEIWSLHVGFSSAAGRSMSGSAAAAVTGAATSTIPTSPARSAP